MGLYCEIGELDGVVYGVCVNIATLVFCERCTDTHTTQLQRDYFETEVLSKETNLPLDSFAVVVPYDPTFFTLSLPLSPSLLTNHPPPLRAPNPTRIRDCEKAVNAETSLADALPLLHT